MKQAYSVERLAYSKKLKTKSAKRKAIAQNLKLNIYLDSLISYLVNKLLELYYLTSLSRIMYFKLTTNDYSLTTS